MSASTTSRKSAPAIAVPANPRHRQPPARKEGPASVPAGRWSVGSPYPAQLATHEALRTFAVKIVMYKSVDVMPEQCSGALHAKKPSPVIPTDVGYGPGGGQEWSRRDMYFLPTVGTRPIRGTGQRRPGRRLPPGLAAVALGWPKWTTSMMTRPDRRRCPLPVGVSSTKYQTRPPLVTWICQRRI